MTLRPKDQHNDASAASRNVVGTQCSPCVSLNVNAASRATAWTTAITFPEYRYGNGVRKAGNDERRGDIAVSHRADRQHPPAGDPECRNSNTQHH